MALDAIEVHPTHVFHERDLICWRRASSAANRRGRRPVSEAELHTVSGVTNEAGGSNVVCDSDGCEASRVHEACRRDPSGCHPTP
jgi:hypothetical protein